ncbi:MAG: GDP-mannose 4,6-dehydratase [Ruminococcus sp.]|nr:GDP-mannose 4,6-dehydratase [Ruminococcus sp.]
MKAMVIGAAGFVGGYLARHLKQELYWKTVLTKLPEETLNERFCTIIDLDVLKPDDITAVLLEHRPDVIFHLAAQSSVALSWKNPQMTMTVNVMGCINLLEAVRNIEGYNPRILLIGSGEEYGHLPPDVSLVSEETPLHPGNPYAVTKVTQNLFGAMYAKAYGMEIVMVRAFNHIGAGQQPQFVAADFCKQTAEIVCGKRENVIRTGNLSAKRDFTDVRDVVRAYGLLAQRGRAGEIYNVGSGKSIAIEELLQEIIRLSGLHIRTETDPGKLRPADIPDVRADITKLQKDTGWSPEIPLWQTLCEMLAYFIKEQKGER